MRFAILPLHLSKVLRVPRKSDTGSCEVLHLSRKIISANLKIWCSKMQPLSGNQCPDLLTALMNMSLVLRLPWKMHLCRSSSNVPRLPSILFANATKPSRFAHFWQDAQSRAPATRNGIWTSKNAPNPSVFCTFDFEMCFALQRRALFRHLSYQKWSEPGMFCTFWLRNVLRATTTCTFSTSQLPKVVGTWCVLYILLEMCFAPQQRALFRHLNFQKWSDTGVFCTFCLRNGKSEQNVRVGAFEEDLQRCIFRGRRSTRDMFIRDVRRWGRWFPERGCILEHQIFSFGKMILHDRCSTSYDLASLFRGRRSTLDRWSGKSQNVLVRGRQLCTQLSVFEGSLAELFRFWCCQLRKLRKSRRIVLFLMLSTPKIEEVSQNCFIFDVVKFKIEEASQNCRVFEVSQKSSDFKLADRQTDRQRQTETDRDRERDRETDRQTDRQAGRQAGRQRDREIERERDRKKEGQKERKKGKKERKIERPIHR